MMNVFWPMPSVVALLDLTEGRSYILSSECDLEILWKRSSLGNENLILDLEKLSGELQMATPVDATTDIFNIIVG